MKYIFLLLCLPLFAHAQTVHVKKGEINYEGTVKVKGVSNHELYERASKALQQIVDKNEQKEVVITGNQEGEVVANGKLKLSSDPDTADNKLLYTVKIKVEDGQYKYHIYKVHVEKLKNGKKVDDISSSDLLKGMDTSGDKATKAEKQLNEIDMSLQKVIALIKSSIHNSYLSQNHP